MVLVSALTGGWYWLMVVRPGWPEKPWQGTLYVAVAVLLWFALAMLHPAYQLLLFVLYAQVYWVLPVRLAVPWSVALTALIVLRGLVQTSGDPLAWIIP